MDKSRRESAIVKLERQFDDLWIGLAQADHQISQMSRLLDRKNTCLVDLRDQLRKQFEDTRALSRSHDNVKDAAERLRISRRWRLANPEAELKAGLIPDTVFPGYGHRDKIVAGYSHWRASHQEIVKIDSVGSHGEEAVAVLSQLRA